MRIVYWSDRLHYAFSLLFTSTAWPISIPAVPKGVVCPWPIALCLLFTTMTLTTAKPLVPKEVVYPWSFAFWLWHGQTCNSKGGSVPVTICIMLSLYIHDRGKFSGSKGSSVPLIICIMPSLYIHDRGKTSGSKVYPWSFALCHLFSSMMEAKPPESNSKGSSVPWSIALQKNYHKLFFYCFFKVPSASWAKIRTLDLWSNVVLTVQCLHDLTFPFHPPSLS